MNRCLVAVVLTVGLWQVALVSADVDESAPVAFGFPSLLNTDAMTDDDDPENWDRDASLASGGNGLWLAAWCRYGLGFYLSRTIDDGATWSPPTRVPLADWVYDPFAGSDIVCDRSGHAIFVWTYDRSLSASYSHDAGETWSDPVAIEASCSSARPSVTTDGDGTWIIVWETCADLPGNSQYNWDIAFSRSEDNGVTWSEPMPVAHGTTAHVDDYGADVAAGADGVWMTVWQSRRSDDDYQLAVSRSTDEGRTWTSPQLVHRAFYPDRDFQMFLSSRVAGDADGNWVIVWDGWDEASSEVEKGRGIYVTHSTDNGEAWSEPQLLSPPLVYERDANISPEVATDGNGRWLALWETKYPPNVQPYGSDSDIMVSQCYQDFQWSPPVLLNLHADRDSYWDSDDSPAIATDGNGLWMTVWSSNYPYEGPAGSDMEIMFAAGPDSDHDGLTDEVENQLGTDPYNSDTDGDLIQDRTELHFGTDPVDPTSSPIDIDSSGGTDAIDIQLVINRALGIGTHLRTDVNRDGVTDAVDVQLVINTALGLDVSEQLWQ